MADFIDRQTATRLLYAEFKDFWELPSLAIDRAVQTHVTKLSDIYKKLPAVDAVEVGSCEGCIYSHRKRPQKCSCCRRNRDLKDCYERREENDHP